MHFTEEGGIVYACAYCLDQGWVYTRKDDGKPDYGHVRRCQCRVQIEKQQELPEAHPERPSKRGSR